MLFYPTTQAVWAQGQAALTGTVSSDAEGNMEGVVVTAKKPNSIVQVSVTTDAQGRYTFPENRLEPGEYTISIRAVGYDIDCPDQGDRGVREDHHDRHQAQEDQKSRQPAHQRRVDDEHPRHRRAKGDAAQLHRLSHDGTHRALDARFRRVDAGDHPHDGLWRREPADQAAAHVGYELARARRSNTARWPTISRPSI